MAAGYGEEEELWKCPKHPSKRKRNGGICPACLRDRLVGLCPDCANVRPCACAASNTTSSSSSSSSSRRVSSLIDGEPSFRRSRSVAVPGFIRSNTAKAKTPSFFSILRRNSKSKRNEGIESNSEHTVGGIVDNRDNRIEDFARLITRSRSVSVGMTSGLGRDDVTSPAKGKFWNFPSPLKVFRSSRFPKFVIQDRSPLHRG